MMKRFLVILLVTTLCVVTNIILISKVESAPSGFYFINGIDRFSDEYRFEGLSSIFIDDDELYVVDNGGNRIYILNLDGTSVFQFGKEKGIVLPIDVFVYSNYIYVSAEGKDFIEILNMRGEKIGKIEPPYEGFAPGKMAILSPLHPPLTKPLTSLNSEMSRAKEGGDVEVSLTKGENGGGEGFLVVDRITLNICVFDWDGKYQYKFGGRNIFKSIGGIAAKNGKIYVSVMSDNPVVRVFDIKGKYISGFGQIGEGEQNFSMPSGIKVDSQGTIWIVDAFKHRVTGFNEEGKRQGEFGISRNPKEVLYYPLSVDSKGDMFYVIEKGRGRLSIFRRVDK